MVIKSKNRFVLIGFILLISFGLNGVFSALFHPGQQEYYKGSYFDTGQFNSDVNQFIDYLGMFELNPVTEEEAKKAITVTEADIEEYRNRYGNLEMQLEDIRRQYQSRIQLAISQNNRQLADALTTERDKKLDDITKNHTSDDYVRPKITKEKEQQIQEEFRQRESLRANYLQYKASFKYHIKNIATGDVYSNLDTTSAESIDQQLSSDNTFVVRDFPASLPNNGVSYTVPNYNNRVTRSYKNFSGSVEAVAVVPAPKANGPFEGKIAVLKSAPPSSQLMMHQYDFKQKQTVFVIYTIAAIIACVISVYLFRRTKIIQSVALEKWAPFANRIPVDIMSAIFGVFALVTFAYLVSNQPSYNGQIRPFFDDLLSTLFICAILVAVTYISGRLLLNRLQDVPNLKAEWQRSVIYRTSQGLAAAFMNRSIATQVVVLLVVVFFWGGGTFLAVSQPGFFPLYLLAVLFVGLPTMIILIRRIGYFNRIVNYTTELASGNYQADLPVAGKSVLAHLAGGLNTLKRGVNISQKEQAKSERLKTELITNVSHDLRTPLTSVITYTELLKNPDLSNEDREAYIQIIDRKSKRLQVLIDDLFEASKMASGNIELVNEKADLVQLLQQTLAEHNEEINKSTLHFRLKTPDIPVYAIVDGQKLWRVFDNIIGNILKYALENTRVHISLETVKDRVIISFKNVTKYELSENVDELFERFKRGDTSRHTEGSGLGLAIAKSIVDLHAGSLDIEVDGDLFKVTVSLQSLI